MKRLAPITAGGFPSREWRAYFERHRDINRGHEAEIDWAAEAKGSPSSRAALARSMQRFEVGERCDGDRYLRSARVSADADYLEAARMFVAEEQTHARLYSLALTHLEWPTLEAHWTDDVFVRLRRSLGIRTKVTLFLVVEIVALEYFEALQRSCPEPVIAALASCILADEVDHVRFQVDQLKWLYAKSPGLCRRAGIVLGWVVAVGAATVVALDHRGALATVTLSKREFLGRSLRRYRREIRPFARARDDYLRPST